MDAIRHKKYEELLLEELSSLILSGEIKDPRVGPFVSLTRVEAARDLSVAKVYVSAFGAVTAANASRLGAADSAAPAGAAAEATQDAQAAKAAENADEARRVDEAAAGLQHAAGFIQARIAKRIRMRLTPKLVFVADHGIKEGFELNERIKGLFQ
jgi:ribosome-binding factor A